MSPPRKTLLLFLAVCGLGWVSYEFFQRKEMPAAPPDRVEVLKRQIEEAMSGDSCFLSVSSLTWRPNQKHYRVDVEVLQACAKAQAQRMAGRVAELVRHETDGIDAEVWLYSLGH
jgi:hypothetical protein